MKRLLLSVILLATAYCQAEPILPEEAKNHIGEKVCVRGLVEQVSLQEGPRFSQLWRSLPKSDFTGFVPVQNVASVGGQEFLRSRALSRLAISLPLPPGWLLKTFSMSLSDNINCVQ